MARQRRTPRPSAVPLDPETRRARNRAIRDSIAANRSKRLAIAEAMARHYGLKAGDRILDVCCGKGFLLYEFTRAVPGVEVTPSAWARERTKRSGCESCSSSRNQ